MDFNEDYPTDDYILKFEVERITHSCLCVAVEYDEFSLIRLFTAYFPYPFNSDDIKYKRSKYQKRVIKKQQDNLFFSFPKEVTYTILRLIPFSDMKNMMMTCVSFYKLITGPIGEMALRHRYLNNKIAVRYDQGLDIYSEYPPSNCKNSRFWWCKTKNIICIYKFCQRHLKDRNNFVGGEYINFSRKNKFDRRRYLRDGDFGDRYVSITESKNYEHSKYIDLMALRLSVQIKSEISHFIDNSQACWRFGNRSNCAMSYDDDWW